MAQTYIKRAKTKGLQNKVYFYYMRMKWDHGFVSFGNPALINCKTLTNVTSTVSECPLSVMLWKQRGFRFVGVETGDRLSPYGLQRMLVLWKLFNMTVLTLYWPFSPKRRGSKILAINWGSLTWAVYMSCLLSQLFIFPLQKVENKFAGNGVVEIKLNTISNPCNLNRTSFKIFQVLF